MIVVGVLSFAMGLQNAAVLYHAVPDVATNVMTLTLVRLLSNWSVVGGTNQRWKYRAASLSVFFVAALVGAVLVRISAGAADGSRRRLSDRAALPPARAFPGR
jgi:uncharacterized membrane protein YoaK (UPF0700 family)